MIPFLDLKAQYNSIKTEIDDKIQKVIDNTAFVGGRFVKEFEESIESYLNRKNSIGVNSGTAALFLSLKALGISKGDEVIVPASTFIATSEAVSMTGAKVNFTDVKKDDLLIDIDKIKLNKNVKAIIPVDLYGKMVNPTDIMMFSMENHLKIVWDCAQSLGAEIKIDDKFNKAGSYGITSCFSFYPGKNLGAFGDGGLISTDDNNLSELIRKMSNHGRADKYDHTFEAYNERLDGIQAAVLNVKLKYLNNWNNKRREIAKLYRKRMKEIGIWFQNVDEKDNPSYHLFVIQHSKRDDLQKFLKDNNISTGIHYPISIPFLKAYGYLNHNYDEYPISKEASGKLLSLPIYPELKLEDVEYICDKIEKFVRDNGI